MYDALCMYSFNFLSSYLPFLLIVLVYGNLSGTNQTDVETSAVGDCEATESSSGRREVIIVVCASAPPDEWNLGKSRKRTGHSATPPRKCRIVSHTHFSMMGQSWLSTKFRIVSKKHTVL